MSIGPLRDFTAAAAATPLGEGLMLYPHWRGWEVVYTGGAQWRPRFKRIITAVTGGWAVHQGEYMPATRYASKEEAIQAAADELRAEDAVLRLEGR